MSKLENGLVQIYTGDGKGKSTAAFGLALRAVGHGFKVCIIQFMKGRDNSGELSGLKRLEPECQVYHFGLDGWVIKGQALEEDVSAAEQALSLAESKINSGDWDIVILDELVNAIWFNLISEDSVLNIIKEKPFNVELVLTGRNASERLKESADLVTEMKLRKHPFEQGIVARKGIEF